MNSLSRFLAWLARSDRQMRRCGRDKGDLARDQSGAIMVAGVFMAVLLAAAIFLIIGTGDAVVYRERVQDAADAVAYTSAGIHARGMNLIVLINLIMVALMAILVALKMLIMILGIIIGICIIITAASFGLGAAICAPIIEYGTVLEEKLNTAASYYEKFLNVALPILSKTEVVIALTTPYVGLAKSVTVGGKYKPLVKQGFAVSPSMIPFVPDTRKLGLPVKEMAFDKFCGKAAEKGGEWAFFWAPGWLKSGASKFASWVAKAFPSYFCGGTGEKGGDTKINETSFNDLEKMVKGQCDDAFKNCTADKKETSYCTPLGGGKVDFNTALCKTDLKKKLKESLDKNLKNGKGTIDPGSGKLLDFKNKTPKDIWDEAKNGSFWMQVYGLTFGEKEWPRRNDKGIAIASKAGLPKPDVAWGNFRVAQAEFYFDGSGEWEGLKEDCMFEMAWRARLRRFDLSGINIAQGVIGQVFDVVVKKLNIKSQFEDILNKGGTLGAVLGANLYEKADEFASSLVKKTFGAPIDKALNGMVPSWEIIH
jgi:hypothetical protein